MYMHCASGQDSIKELKGQTIVEVGSGRGGGLEYVKRTMKAETAIGIDFSINQV